MLVQGEKMMIWHCAIIRYKRVPDGIAKDVIFEAMTLV